MGRLDGKIALVSGASKGIGAGIAVAMAAEGATVVVNYATDAVGAAKTIAKIEGNGGRAIALQADVSNSTDVKRMIAAVADRFSRLDILVNNAAVYKWFPIEDLTQGEFDREFSINVFGTLQMTKEALPLLSVQGGSIINIGSGSTTMLLPGSVVYTASKGAIDCITPILSRELGARGIRVNSINPGGVLTEGLENLGVLGTELEKELIDKTPLGRMGKPQDIGPVAVFLASDESAWITGEIILVSGGLR
jgi:3-oxoacyl-[acyl-carrier protein] reductase